MFYFLLMSSFYYPQHGVWENFMKPYIWYYLQQPGGRRTLMTAICCLRAVILGKSQGKCWHCGAPRWETDLRNQGQVCREGKIWAGSQDRKCGMAIEAEKLHGYRPGDVESMAAGWHYEQPEALGVQEVCGSGTGASSKDHLWKSCRAMLRTSHWCL